MPVQDFSARTRLERFHTCRSLETVAYSLQPSAQLEQGRAPLCVRLRSLLLTFVDVFPLVGSPVAAFAPTLYAAHDGIDGRRFR